MATVKGILGQASPTAGSTVTLYTVPSGKTATVKVVFANRAVSSASVNLAVSPDGAALEDKHYLTYEFFIASRDAVSSVTYTLGADDVVRVKSSNGEVSFTCTGIEQDE
jgi:hypothetical protein